VIHLDKNQAGEVEPYCILLKIVVMHYNVAGMYFVLR